MFPSGTVNSLIVADVYCAGDRDGLAISVVRKYTLSTNSNCDETSTKQGVVIY